MKSIMGIIVMLTVAAVMAGDEWMQKICKDHPRMFVNRQTLSQLRKRAETVCKDDFDKIKKEVDALPAEPELVFIKNRFSLAPNGTVIYKTGGQGQCLVKSDGTQTAVKAALLYLVTGEEQYLVKAKNYLKMALRFFNWCLDHKTMTAWENKNRVNALVAYDWIYNGLTPQERREIIIPFLKYIQAMQQVRFPHNTGGYDSGNYGVPSFLWFAGLAAYGDGINDELAKDFLRRGYDLNERMMDYRDKLSAGSGLLSAATVGYSFGDYPYASLLFMETWQSATGEDISSRWRQMRDFPNWFDWSKIPGKDHLLCHGTGDMPHDNNVLNTKRMYDHMAQIVHIYKKSHPETADMALTLINCLPDEHRRFSYKYTNDGYPFLPFVLFNFDPEQKVHEQMKLSSKKAELFDSFGLVIMRSGTGKDDTYCLFRAGAKYDIHQHYDENHFTLYKRDFLALDSGSRTKTLHHCYFCPQSVAHNTILIHMDNEPMPYYWKPWGGAEAEKDTGEKYYNHGGQCKLLGAERLAFYTGDLYTYAANDATKVYCGKKCKEAVRQFVYIYSDYFVVYDRVASVKPEQRKEWLLHTVNEPVEIGRNTFRADCGQGRLFMRTLLPVDALQRKVGGPEKQFVASGRNWPLPGGEKAFAKVKYAGQWRLEVLNKTPVDKVRFLHLIQVGDVGKTADMIPAELLSTKNEDGLKFTDMKGRKWQIMFNREGKVGGSIKTWDGDREILNQTLAGKNNGNQ
ncbi:MAG: heparinase II/III family protein [Victivallales bacterium]|nr:heparinase II/III family protein [Victivallales bacterium]